MAKHQPLTVRRYANHRCLPLATFIVIPVSFGMPRVVKLSPSR